MFFKKPKKKNFIIRYLCLFLSLFISFRYESFLKASSIQQERSCIQDQNKLQTFLLPSKSIIINYSSKEGTVNHLSSIKSTNISINLAFEPFRKIRDPLGVLRDNSYRKCVNKLADQRRTPPPFRTSSSKRASYCRCLANEVTFFKRIPDIVYEEGWHCRKHILN